MRWFSFIMILLIATILEAGNLLNLFAVGNWHIRPGILITLLVYYTMTCRTCDAISCSFIIGLAADLSGGLLGPHMICYGIVGFMVNSISQTLLMKRAIHKALFVFLIFLITEICSHWLTILRIQQNQADFYSSMFLTAVYTAIISPFIWFGGVVVRLAVATVFS